MSYSCVLNTNFVDWWQKDPKSTHCFKCCVLNTNFVDWWQFVSYGRSCCVLSPIYKIRIQYTTSRNHSFTLLLSPIYKIRIQYTTDKHLPYPSCYYVTNLQNSYSIHNVNERRRCFWHKKIWGSPIYKIRIQYTTLGVVYLKFCQISHQSTKFVFNTQLKNFPTNDLRLNCHQSTKFVFNTQRLQRSLHPNKSKSHQSGCVLKNFVDWWQTQ